MRAHDLAAVVICLALGCGAGSNGTIDFQVSSSAVSSGVGQYQVAFVEAPGDFCGSFHSDECLANQISRSQLVPMFDETGRQVTTAVVDAASASAGVVVTVAVGSHYALVVESMTASPASVLQNGCRGSLSIAPGLNPAQTVQMTALPADGGTLPCSTNPIF